MISVISGRVSPHAFSRGEVVDFAAKETPSGYSKIRFSLAHIFFHIEDEESCCIAAREKLKKLVDDKVSKCVVSHHLMD